MGALTQACSHLEGHLRLLSIQVRLLRAQTWAHGPCGACIPEPSGLGMGSRECQASARAASKGGWRAALQFSGGAPRPPTTWGPGPGEAQLATTSVVTRGLCAGQDGMGWPCSVGRAEPGPPQACAHLAVPGRGGQQVDCPGPRNNKTRQLWVDEWLLEPVHSLRLD